LHFASQINTSSLRAHGILRHLYFLRPRNSARSLSAYPTVQRHNTCTLSFNRLTTRKMKNFKLPMGGDDFPPGTPSRTNQFVWYRLIRYSCQRARSTRPGLLKILLFLLNFTNLRPSPYQFFLLRLQISLVSASNRRLRRPSSYPILRFEPPRTAVTSRATLMRPKIFFSALGTRNERHQQQMPVLPHSACGS